MDIDENNTIEDGGITLDFLTIEIPLGLYQIILDHRILLDHHI